ncbi:uncharacterized protein LOC123520256 [Portunus trituberculatus]|uniref:uncharacterized protein LOC123520256 n=1 Tax=Portunus trituberculatus TaxID=210409 RepID=UPI001E1CBC50|nr:uncharacterized protein LOC123520256 [Portunus trituberculatus]XP_045138300.1 uncharacterized protein LOC123520256 [Portunus trituberculatus]XP_045138301.1 uncharacterized protein LOC123520256 [Portunus trituberculatus]
MEVDVDMRDSISPGKRGQPDTPLMTARKGPAAALPKIIPKPRTSTLRPRSCSEVRKAGRLFANPAKVSCVLHDSAFGKYILEGETLSLGNGSSLIVAVWAHTLPKVPMLQSPSFTLGYIIRKDRGQGRGGGVLLAIHDSRLIASPYPSVSRWASGGCCGQGWT